MRGDRAGLSLDIDTAVPALLLKIGQYPVHSGSLGVLRTLGRLGVPVYAITERGLTPAAASRYCTGRFVWRATGHERPSTLIPLLQAAGERIGRRSVIVPVDDESAVLVAEYAAELSDRFILPRVAPSLPRRLASKPGLSRLCAEHGIPSPASVTPAGAGEVTEFAAAASFPVVAKNAEPWERRRHPVVPGTTVLHGKDELLALADRMPAGGHPGLILQEYLPVEHSQDWIVHLYCDADSACLVLFTGLKVRSWPVNAGVTACAVSAANPEVGALAERFCREIGYRGTADLDWRFDGRDRSYKLVDFNPRPGNQFRLFETEAGVDVVRALHLDLTGRVVPAAPQVQGRRIIVEHTEIPARLAYRMRARRAAPPDPVESVPSGRPGDAVEPTSTELAWLVPDDPLPFFVMIRHAVRPALAELLRLLRVRARRESGSGRRSVPPAPRLRA